MHRIQIMSHGVQGHTQTRAIIYLSIFIYFAHQVTLLNIDRIYINVNK